MSYGIVLFVNSRSPCNCCQNCGFVFGKCSSPQHATFDGRFFLEIPTTLRSTVNFGGTTYFCYK